MSTAYILLACLGCTQIICFGKIFKPLREWHSKQRFHFPIGCPMCVGFWVGVGLRLLLWSAAGSNPTLWQASVLLFMHGCASSAFSYAGCMLIQDDGLRFHPIDKSRNPVFRKR